MRPLPYPPARRDPESGHTLHGRRYADPYAWLEDLHSPEAQQWLAAQEALTHSVLRTLPERPALRAALERATRVSRRAPPVLAGPDGRAFQLHTDAGDDRPRLLVRRRAGAALEPLLDPNTWPAREALVFAVPSPDGRHVAYGKAEGGTHGARIHVLEVDTGRLLPDRPRGTEHASLAWLPDGTGFLYTACPEPGAVPPGDEAHWNAVHLHRLGASVPAVRVFGDDTVKEYWCTVKVTECGRYAVCTKWDYVHANDVSLLRLADGALLPVAEGMRGLQQVQLVDDTLLVVTDRDAPRGRLCVASLDAPTHWRTLLPEGEDTLQTVTGVGGRLYAVSSRAASHRVHVHALDGTHLRDVTLPALGAVNRNEGEGLVSGVTGSWRGDTVWLSFQSWAQPPSLYRYDFAADRLTPEHVPDVGLDTTELVTEQVAFPSRDGTRVSMVLVHRRGLPRDGRRAVRLTAYGGFNIALEPRYAPVHAAWLQQGGVLAFAHVRGGGEYGRAWHEAARTTRRQNAFDDFVAAARWLVEAGYTTPGRLAARGNSNGGLLVAVAALQAPDAFGAVFSRAAVLDMLRFPRFSHLSAATLEYGDPADPVEGTYLAGYSPYHTVRAGPRYPAMLFASALNDRNAPPDDPPRMVARLQAEAQGGPFLYLPLRDAGHAGGTTRTAQLEHDTDELAFYCWALGPPGTGRAS